MSFRRFFHRAHQPIGINSLSLSLFPTLPDLLKFKSRARTDKDDVIKSFLQQAQRACEWAVVPSNRSQATANMISRIQKLFPELPVDHDQLKESVDLAADTLLDCKGRACHMEEEVWKKFLNWLYDAGLMTTKMQSRGQSSDTKTSLDGLRGGDAGEALPRDAVKTTDLFTSAFLLPR